MRAGVAGRAELQSNRSLESARDAGASRRTVRIALAANAVIAVAKLVGGLVSGSAAMLAEAAHSVADTTNQGFLLVSIHLGQRDASPDHPFGHGQQRFLWTFMAAVGMFLAGAVFAIGYGVYALAGEAGAGSGHTIAYGVLGCAFVAEGTSWLRALRQTRREGRAAGMGVLAYARATRDPSVKLVLFEDTAALVGVLVAAAGIGLDQATGSQLFDPAASIMIGLVLVAVAAWMGHDAGHLLVGASARPAERETVERVIEEFPEIESVIELLTLVLGPRALLVAARVDLRDAIDSERVEEISAEIDQRLREAVPDVTEVFLDATARSQAR